MNDSPPYNPIPASSISSGRALKESTNTQTPPPLLLRRRTDLRDGASLNAQAEREKEPGRRESPLDTSASLPGLLRRSATGGVGATGNSPASPWSNTGGGFSPMGSFANFGLADMSGQPSTPGEKKQHPGSTRGTSRWSKLMSRDHHEDSVTGDKPSTGNLGRLGEAPIEPSARNWEAARGNRSVNHNADLFSEQDSSGDNVGQDVIHARQHQRSSVGTSTAQQFRHSLGFSDMTDPSVLPGFRDVGHDRAGQQRFGVPQQNVLGEGEPLSPTETNPYQSPIPEKVETEEVDTDDSDIQNLHHPGLSSIADDSGMGRYGNASRGFTSGVEDYGVERSQNSSVAQPRGFPSMVGMGSVGGASGSQGWPTTGASTSRAERDQNITSPDFANPMFGTLGDYQLPKIGSGGRLPSTVAGSSGTTGRPSKLSSLFPSAMQAPMHGGDIGKQSIETGSSDIREMQARQSIVDGLPPQSFDHFASGFPGPGRDADMPLRVGRSLYEDMQPFNNDESRNRPSTGNSVLSNDSLPTPLTSAPMSDSTQAPLSALRNIGSQSAVSSVRNPLQPGVQQSQSTANPTSQAGPTQAGQPPQSQQRTMVMPDRMRWIYRDPQGSIQGPWSGLEMHDWFKAGFFSAELLVKKYEDPEFEPLGQLIRRIGNSREPFLVPQIGIPHGPPSSQTNTPWNPVNSPAAANQVASPAGSVQPPFAGAFPSFGTTLTAEQQNALERRKQEEQFLMARQKEYLAQQQVLQKQMQQMQGVAHGVHPQQLNHHSSAHSLHSQPSYGSITSPGTFHQTPPQGPIQPPQAASGFFDPQMRHSLPGYLGPIGPANDFSSAGAGISREGELAALLARQSLNLEGSQQPLGFGALAFNQQPQDTTSHPQNVAAMLAQRAQLHSEQMKSEAILGMGSEGQHGSNDRLQQFNDLRGRLDDDYGQGLDFASGGRSMAPLTGQDDQSSRYNQRRGDAGMEIQGQPDEAQKLVTPVGPYTSSKDSEVLSLTQQVQKAASAKQSPALVSQSESVWGRAEKAGLPHPFPPPPPQSISPLPAPAAQRNRQHLPDALTIDQETRPRSQTSSVETPNAILSLAPWAREAGDGPKGPSLKEIQEAEARKAAKAEEAASAARRAYMERERVSQQSVVAPAPGLPSSSTWGSGTSPVTPTTAGASAWAKPLAGKPTAGAVEGGTKKTLSQIQKEEEARKQKVAAAATAASVASVTNNGGDGVMSGVPGGKRYADLAGKAVAVAAAAQPGSAASAWTTVGASGKVKGSAGPATNGPAGLKTVSGIGAAAPGTKTKTAMSGGKNASTGNNSSVAGQASAHEEFTRWAKGALVKGLNSNINGE